MLAGTREVTGQRGRLDRDRRQIGDLEAAARRLSRRATEARGAEARFAADLADAARRSGIADDGFGAVDAGDDLLAAARARVAARRDDVGEIRRLLQAIRDAQAKRALREQDLGGKQTAEAGQEQACAAAQARLGQARQAAAGELAEWRDRWAARVAGSRSPGFVSPDSGPADPGAPPREYIVSAADAAAIAAALDRIGEPDAVSLTEVFDGLIADRQAATITARANLETELREVRGRLAGLRAERDAIAAEQDDAPPASDLRPASRNGRPGAPLWRLVRFADGIGDAEAAAVEGALYGAGLLTAWIHPDPALTEAALAATEADGYLLPSEPVSDRSLASVLVPEEQDDVAPAVITAVLRSIALTDDIAAAPAPAVSTKAQFSYGVHAGARPKAAPEYIGATNRAHRRRARLAEYDELIAQAAAQEQRLSGELDRAGARLEDFRRARQQLPDTRPVARAAEAVSTRAVLLARARDETAAARQALDGATAEVDARTRQLRQAAAERRMPAEASQVDAVARAAAEFENAATQLHAERVKLAQAEEDLAAQTETIEQRRLEYAEAADALAERERQQQALEEEFRTLEETLQADVQQVLEQIRETERLLSAASQAYRRARRARPAPNTTRPPRPRRSCAASGSRWPRRSASSTSRPRCSAEYAGPDLRPLAGVTTATPWPDPDRWPDPARAAEDLAAVLADGEATLTRKELSGGCFRRAWPGSSTRSPPPPAAGARSPRARSRTPRTGCRSRSRTSPRPSPLATGITGWTGNRVPSSPCT